MANVFIKQVLFERDIQSGQMVVKVLTNHGRFVVGIDHRIAERFYDMVVEKARTDIEQILTEEEIWRKLNENRDSEE